MSDGLVCYCPGCRKHGDQPLDDCVDCSRIYWADCLRHGDSDE